MCYGGWDFPLCRAGEFFHHMPGFLWLHLSSTFKIPVNSRARVQQDSHHIYLRLISVASEGSLFSSLYKSRIIPLVSQECFFLSFLQSYAIMDSCDCLLPYFIHKYPWLKQSSSALQKEMCQTKLSSLTVSARNPRELILSVTKCLSNLALPSTYSSTELGKKIRALI